MDTPESNWSVNRRWWTEERITELKARWLNQQSASEIAEAMGAPSRSAIVGKAWRLGLAGTKANSPTRRRANGATIIPVPRPPIVLRGPVKPMVFKPQTPFRNPKRFIELKETECHWPGDGQPGPDMLCCAEPVVEGRPYCLTHCRIAYVKANPPKQ
jgi:GcrA cell cycle regulator